MRPQCRPVFSRRRLLVAAGLVVALPVAAWFLARHAVARWAVGRALSAAGLRPATFRIESVGLTGLSIADLSVGTVPWLSAEHVRVAYSSTALLAGRVGTVRIGGAVWTVSVREGVIDWGFRPRTGTEPIAFSLPCDRVDIGDAVTRVIVDGVTHEASLNGQLAPRPGSSIDYRFDVLVQGWAVALTGSAGSTPDALTVRLELDATSGPRGPVPGAPGVHLDGSWTRAHSDGSSRLDGRAAVVSLIRRVGGADVSLTRASVAGQAELDGSGVVRALTASAAAEGLRANGVDLPAVELNGVRLDGSLLRFTVGAEGNGWRLEGADGTAAWATGDEHAFTIALAASEPTIERPDLGLEGRLGEVAGILSVVAAGTGLRLRDGALTMRGGALLAGDTPVSDAALAVVLRSPESLQVTTLTAIVGDGGVVSVDPFSLDPGAPRPRTRVTLTNLSLGEWLPRLSGGRVLGEGRVSGHLDVGLDLTGGGPVVTALSGAFRADPAHGFIQVLDADWLGEHLEQQEPRFATDPAMRQVRDRLVAALRDFAFNRLTVDLSRSGDRTLAPAYVSGFGRHGEDPQGVNLTLDLQVEDAWVELVARLITESRIRSAAQDALSRFFGAPAPRDEQK